MTEQHELVSSLPKGMWASARAGALALAEAESVSIASHIDADGICAATIARTSLERLGKDVDVRFFKKLDEAAIKSVTAKGDSVAWFTDLGSGSLSKMEGARAVVTDHHMPESLSSSGSRDGQMTLSDFTTIHHVNPHLHGVSGASDLSGAGSTFLVALALDGRNLDLAHLAVLGSVGDLQDQRTRRLEGINRLMLAAAESQGLISTVQDIRYFGRETRPIHKLLEFSSDPFLPRITGSEDGALAFLLELGIELKEGPSWRTWTDLEPSEREKIIQALRDHLEANRRRPETITRLVGEVYVLAKEKKRTPVRDAKEFATLLNACGRHGRPETGLRICAGDRGVAMAEGETLLRNHRSALSRALTWAKGSGIVRMKNIQFFDAGDEIEDTIVGIVAGMLLGSEGADRSAPMIAFAESTEYSETPKVKASARGTQDLVSRGMDLSAAIRSAAESVGGIGGGHNIAAGATIPADRKKEFLSALDGLVGAQLSGIGQRRG